MADIKTRDAVKGTIKTIDKAAIATERMKSAYAKTKDKAEQGCYADESSATEYAADRLSYGADRIKDEGIHQFNKQGQKAVKETRENIGKAKDKISSYKQKKSAKAAEQHNNGLQIRHGAASRSSAPNSTQRAKSQFIKTRQQGKKTIKTTARNAEKTVKATAKGTVKTTQKSVKTAQATSKAAIKTAEHSAKATKAAAKASAKAAQRAAQAAKATAKATVTAVKAAVKATIAAVKAIIAGVKALVAAIAAGGWIAVVIIIVICLIALIAGSVFGIFFSGEDSGNGMTMQSVVREINAEYDTRLDEIQSSTTYDVLEMSGSRAVWKEVLAVYSVKTATDPDNPQEVATMDEGKKEDLRKLFWEMNKVESHTENKTVKETVEVKENGKTVKKEKDVEKTTLYITISHIDLETMMNNKSFTDEQKEMCRELLSDENNSLWLSVLHGISSSDSDIVKVAQEQLGNVGGQPYWSWYGFSSRVEWCACFVSWCANECEYIENNLIPKYSVCDTGVNWFKTKGEWLDGTEEPQEGMIIFFDWASDGLDGNSDHTGIVEKVESGRVYTIEGNSSDACQENSYPIGYYEILGYGCPAYK